MESRLPMDSSASKSSSPTKKEQELESDRQIKRILRDDGMKKPVIVYPPSQGLNYYSLQLDGQKVEHGNSMIVDIGTSRAYFLR